MARKRNKQKVNKAETSIGKPFTRPYGFPEKGQARIVSSSKFIQDTGVRDLQWPYAYCTYENMMEDPDVYTAVNTPRKIIKKSLTNGEVESTGTAKSDIATKFINYSFNNFSYGTWGESMGNATTALIHGFSDQNLVLEKRTYGPYKNSFVINKLAPRNQKSVYGWVWNKEITEWKGLLQKPPLRFNKITTGFDQHITIPQIPSMLNQNYTYIKAEQLLHFTVDKTDDNPQGNPPLKACYAPWMEKVLVSKYQIVGVSKDMAGALVIRVPQELLERAAEDPAYALELDKLQDDAAALRAGESAYIVLSSDVDPDSKTRDYDIEFKGIDGGGKSYNSSDIIDQKRKAIYNVFSGGAVLLGQDGSSGSYSLSTDKTSLQGFYSECIADQFVEVINTQLIPRLLAANGIYLDHEDMPKYVAEQITETSLDEFSKAGQRLGSVGILTEEMFADMAKKARIKTGDLSKIDYTNKGDSRSGESQGSSGTGDSQSGGANSSTNNENKTLRKTLTFDYEDDDASYFHDNNGLLHVVEKET